MKFVAGQTSPEDALSTGDYPASGSYIDVSGYEWVNVVIHMGAIDASDTPTFKVQQADATNGTLDTISTANCVVTAAADDDDEVVSFYLETATLADDHHFISVDVSGVANGSYGDIMYYLGGARHLPVSQTTALLPTASQKIHAG
jgi:hypothetical protein